MDLSSILKSPSNAASSANKIMVFSPNIPEDVRVKIIAWTLQYSQYRITYGSRNKVLDIHSALTPEFALAFNNVTTLLIGGYTSLIASYINRTLYKQIGSRAPIVRITNEKQLKLIDSIGVENGSMLVMKTDTPFYDSPVGFDFDMINQMVVQFFPNIKKVVVLPPASLDKFIFTQHDNLKNITTFNIRKYTIVNIINTLDDFGILPKRVRDAVNDDIQYTIRHALNSTSSEAELIPMMDHRANIMLNFLVDKKEFPRTFMMRFIEQTTINVSRKVGEFSDMDGALYFVICLYYGAKCLEDVKKAWGRIHPMNGSDFSLFYGKSRMEYRPFSWSYKQLPIGFPIKSSDISSFRSFNEIRIKFNVDIKTPGYPVSNVRNGKTYTSGDEMEFKLTAYGMRILADEILSNTLSAFSGMKVCFTTDEFEFHSD